MLKRLRDTEDGFTLIELLVVVIIIGILAAIAIPTFLSQRERGWQAELTSGLRNVALEVEAGATAEGGDYTGLDANLAAYSANVFGAGVASDVTIAGADTDFTATGFCITGTHALLGGAVGGVGVQQVYDSALGGLQPFVEDGTAC